MTLTLELSPEEEALLHTEAEKAGMNEAEYLRSLIHGWGAPRAVRTPLAVPSLGNRSIAQIIEEIGTVDGLPSDLSTNPKYMEGFGVTKDLRDLAE